MPDLTNLLIVAAVAFGVPFTLGLVPRLRLPAVALEIVAGILIGPSVLGWVTVDGPLRVFSLVGLSFLLLIAGLEVDFDRLRGRTLELALARLQDTTAQIRVRAAFVLLIGFTVAAERFGAEAILGSFLAGAIVKLVDRDRAMTHPQFRLKLEAAGFGVFIPFFFVGSGVKFDGHALFASGSVVARVPLFLAVLLIVRGLPALVFRRVADNRRVVAAGLLQATSLSFLVVVSELGRSLDLITAANGAALIAAGLLSVLLFPLGAFDDPALKYGAERSRAAASGGRGRLRVRAPRRGRARRQGSPPGLRDRPRSGSGLRRRGRW